MGVLTVCLTCWLVFVRETSGEDPGQVADTFIMQIMQHVTRYSLGKKHSRLDAHPLHKIWSHNRQNRAGGPGPRQPGQWRGRVFHKVKIMFVQDTLTVITVCQLHRHPLRHAPGLRPPVRGGGASAGLAGGA